MDKLTTGIKYILLVLFGIVSGGLWLMSILETSSVGADEAVTYNRDYPLIHLFIVLAVFAGASFVMNKIRLNGKKLCLIGKTRDKYRFFGVYGYLTMFVLLFLWVCSTRLRPKADQLMIAEYAAHIARGNYQDFLPGGYLYNQQHQIFLAHLSSVLYRVFGDFYMILFQFANCAFLAAAIWLLGDIYGRLFGKGPQVRLAVIFLFLFFPMDGYVTFVYGTVPGLAASLAAMDQLLRFLACRRKRHMVCCALWAALACMLKSNYLIVLIAVLAVLFLSFLEKPDKRLIAAACLTVFAYVGGNMWVQAYTNRMVGYEMGEGIPKIMFVAMGLQEGPLGPGWWTGWHTKVFINEEFDPDAASRAARDKIGDRVEEMKEDPVYGLGFFLRKTASQWSEPTYESIWIQQARTPVGAVGGLAGRVIGGGKVTKLYEGYCNIFQSVLYLGMLLFAIGQLRLARTAPQELLMPLVFLGGFAFHLFWEAKGQYTLPYCFCCVPMAVWGYQNTICYFSGCSRKTGEIF